MRLIQVAGSAQMSLILYHNAIDLRQQSVCRQNNHRLLYKINHNTECMIQKKTLTTTGVLTTFNSR